MLKISLLDKINRYECVNLVRDNRSIKLKSGNSLIDYLKTTLMFDYDSQTELVDYPTYSKTNHNLILTDWLNNIIFSHYEDNNSQAFDIISVKLKSQGLFM